MTDSPQQYLHIVRSLHYLVIRVFLKEFLDRSGLGKVSHELVPHHPFRYELNGNGEVRQLQTHPLSGRTFSRHRIVVGTKAFPSSVILLQETIYELLVYSHCLMI